MTRVLIGGPQDADDREMKSSPTECEMEVAGTGGPERQERGDSIRSLPAWGPLVVPHRFSPQP